MATASRRSRQSFMHGVLVCTRGIRDRYVDLKANNVAPWILRCLTRHVECDWGDVGEEDWKANDDALKHGARLMSVYKRGDETVWIITDMDAENGCVTTTVLLPEEY